MYTIETCLAERLDSGKWNIVRECPSYGDVRDELASPTFFVVDYMAIITHHHTLLCDTYIYYNGSLIDIGNGGVLFDSIFRKDYGAYSSILSVWRLYSTVSISQIITDILLPEELFNFLAKCTTLAADYVGRRRDVEIQVEVARLDPQTDCDQTLPTHLIESVEALFSISKALRSKTRLHRYNTNTVLTHLAHLMPETDLCYFIHQEIPASLFVRYLVRCAKMNGYVVHD